MLSAMQTQTGFRVCLSSLKVAHSEEERQTAIQEFERVWAPDIKDWEERLIEYAGTHADAEVFTFLKAHLS